MYLRKYVSGKFSMTHDEYYIKQKKKKDKKKKRKTRKTKERIIPRIQAQALNEVSDIFRNRKSKQGRRNYKALVGYRHI